MAFTSISNVLSTSTNGDTFSGPIRIRTIIVKPGSTAGTCTLTVGGKTVFDACVVAANGASQAFYDFTMAIGGGQTLTANLTGTGTTVYIYCM